MQGYFPNLQALLDLGELNYRRILSLFPRWRDLDEYKVECVDTASGNTESEAVFKVIQREKYTTSVEISLRNKLCFADEKHNQMILIRLYHDAKIAEVVLPAKRHIMPGSYKYPNSKMYQVDEKMQSNHFLAEWLAYCERYAEVEPEGGGVARYLIDDKI